MAVKKPLLQPHIDLIRPDTKQTSQPWYEWFKWVQQTLEAFLSTPAGSYTICFDIDGGGAEPDTGVRCWVRAPFAGTIVSARALADQTGSVVCDIWRDIYGNYPPTNGDSITGSAPVTISAGVKSEDTTLTGWTTGIAEGDILALNVDSVSGITHVLVELVVAKT
jgi:hypothetical protein